jgi:hypothetical protein
MLYLSLLDLKKKYMINKNLQFLFSFKISNNYYLERNLNLSFICCDAPGETKVQKKVAFFDYNCIVILLVFRLLFIS